MSLLTNNVYVVAFVGGGSGSVVAQGLSVPIDVLSQHMMLVGQRGAKSTTNGHIERILVPDSLSNASTVRIVKYLSREIYKNERLTGFYRGYFLSTFLVSFNSSLWWPFYYFYQSKFF